MQKYEATCFITGVQNLASHLKKRTQAVVFEITILRRIFGLKRKDMRAEWREVPGQDM
jgi:hypothetical protein